MSIDALVFDILSTASLPLKAAEVVKRLKPQAGRAASPKAVAHTLDQLAATGSVRCITAGKSVLFTTQSLEDATTVMLKTTIHAAKKPPAASSLRSKLPPVLQTHFEAALKALADRGEAFVLPGAKRLVLARRPRASELLSAAQLRTLQKLLEAVNAARQAPLTLKDFAAWVDDEPREASTRPAAIAVVVPGAAELQAWYEADRQRSSTMMIAIPRTFEHYEAWAQAQGGRADSQALRNLMEDLYKQGRLLLEPCERPQDLPEHERAMLVPMSLGPPGYSWCWLA